MTTAITANAGATQWAPLIESVLAAPLANSTKERYRRKLRVFLAWWDQTGREPFNAALVEKYAGALHTEKFPAFDIGHSLVAIKRLARAAAMHGWIDAAVLEGVKSVSGPKVHPTKLRQWLTEAQVQTLMKAVPRDTITGKRDIVLLGFLLYCGLRREEAAKVRFEHIRIIEGQPCIVNLIGKGEKARTVPMPIWLFKAIQTWIDASGLTEGYLLRGLAGWNPMVRSDQKMSNAGIWGVVKVYAKAIGIPSLTPHDLRRTFGRLARKKGIELDQIQQSYGHAHLSTTQHYIGGTMDFENPPCNAIPAPQGM